MIYRVYIGEAEYEHIKDTFSLEKAVKLVKNHNRYLIIEHNTEDNSDSVVTRVEVEKIKSKIKRK